MLKNRTVLPKAGCLAILASIVMFRSRGGEILKIADDDHDDNITMERLAKRVRKESEAFREK